MSSMQERQTSKGLFACRNKSCAGCLERQQYSRVPSFAQSGPHLPCVRVCATPACMASARILGSQHKVDRCCCRPHQAGPNQGTGPALHVHVPNHPPVTPIAPNGPRVGSQRPAVRQVAASTQVLVLALTSNPILLLALVLWRLLWFGGFRLRTWHALGLLWWGLLGGLRRRGV
ncbi:hypothetical protein GQ54DRAFT_25958 [Martensiomyces pterosporus]|nr:hypothetical protein GQ54DRAFT_25958 [Martensiomyces pterosporus]